MVLSSWGSFCQIEAEEGAIIGQPAVQGMQTRQRDASMPGSVDCSRAIGAAWVYPVTARPWFLRGLAYPSGRRLTKESEGEFVLACLRARLPADALDAPLSPLCDGLALRLASAPGTRLRTMPDGRPFNGWMPL